MKLTFCVLVTFVLFGCSSPSPSPTSLPQKESLSKKIEAQLPNYPNTLKIYCNDELLKQATTMNSKVIIYLPIQRARLYVFGKIAADWPVSTGRDGRETPTGSFRILDRQYLAHDSAHPRSYKEPITNLVTEIDEYGKIRARTEVVGYADGVRFDTFPFAMRLTWDGLLMYAREVTHPGVRESGGFVRVPPTMQKKLFQVMKKDSKVLISRACPEPDDCGRVKHEDVEYRPHQRNPLQ